jgi:hypothetical protein
MAISVSRDQKWCASPDWSVGGTSGHGIPAGHLRISVVRWNRLWDEYYKFRPGRPNLPLRRGELYGLTLPREEAQQRKIEHGYLIPYFRKMWWTREQFEARAIERGRISA